MIKCRWASGPKPVPYSSCLLVGWLVCLLSRFKVSLTVRMGSSSSASPSYRYGTYRSVLDDTHGESPVQYRMYVLCGRFRRFWAGPRCLSSSNSFVYNVVLSFCTGTYVQFFVNQKMNHSNQSLSKRDSPKTDWCTRHAHCTCTVVIPEAQQQH